MAFGCCSIPKTTKQLVSLFPPPFLLLSFLSVSQQGSLLHNSAMLRREPSRLPLTTDDVEAYDKARKEQVRLISFPSSLSPLSISRRLSDSSLVSSFLGRTPLVLLVPCAWSHSWSFLLFCCYTIPCSQQRVSRSLACSASITVRSWHLRPPHALLPSSSRPQKLPQHRLHHWQRRGVLQCNSALALAAQPQPSSRPRGFPPSLPTTRNKRIKSVCA